MLNLTLGQPDPSPTTYDYASHGVIGWDSSTKSVGVTTMVLDENLVEVDLVTSASGVSVTRIRGDVTEQLTSVTGFTTYQRCLRIFNSSSKSWYSLCAVY